jgi:hypothetical protein
MNQSIKQNEKSSADAARVMCDIYQQNTLKPRSNLSQVGSVRGANTFSNHNQSLTRKSLTGPVHLGFLVALNEILSGDFNEPINQTK